jgi:DNA-binding CsgD family transcriptional regulator
MPQPRLSDLGRITRFVGTALDYEGDAPFAPPVLEELRTVIPADSISFLEVDLVARVDLAGVSIGEEDLEGAEDGLYWILRGEHPLSSYRVRSSDWGAARLSGLIGRLQLHRSRIYHEWFRPWAVEDELTAGLDSPDEHKKIFSFDRRDGPDFGDRDRDVLDALRPWLARVYRVADDRRRLREALAQVEAVDVDRSELPLTNRERQILELVGEGKTNAQVAQSLWISPGTVRRHLENAFAKLEVHTRTAAVARLRRRPG